MYNLIFDLDDTLIECGVHYSEVKQEFIDYSHTRTFVPKDTIEKILNGIDIACTSLPQGFNRERFPRSFEATSLALDVIRGMEPNIQASRDSFDIADNVFDMPYRMFDGVRDMLIKYKMGGRQLFLVTKGDAEVQWSKVNKHNLLDIFPFNRIHVVPKKNAEVLTKIIESHKLHKEGTAYIGDSLRDDVGSANEVGITSVLVHAPANVGWAYENTAHTPTHRISTITDLPTIFPY